MTKQEMINRIISEAEYCKTVHDLGGTKENLYAIAEALISCVVLTKEQVKTGIDPLRNCNAGCCDGCTGCDLVGEIDRQLEDVKK